ncbi:MAG TPA: response regulator [Ktedonobacteraceae bacterium]
MTDASPFIRSQEADILQETIVIVEDDPANAEVLTLLLQLDGRYKTRSFGRANDVLNSIDEIKSINPVLFVLDYSLPYMTGLELYHRLHAIQEFEEIPAILLTAKTIRDDEKELIAQDHLFFVPKPYSIDHLLAIIQQATF